MKSLQIVKNHFQENISVKKLAAELLPEKIVAAADLMTQCLSKGNKILCCGNGGSASDSQHFSAEMLNRFQMARAPLAAIALSTDTSTLTAIANDFDYSLVFSKQIEALGKPGDVLLAISTSGNSASIVTAINTAHAKKIDIIALTGRDGGTIAKILANNDIEIRVPADVTIRIQETHILVIHCLCDLIEQQLYNPEE